MVLLPQPPNKPAHNKAPPPTPPPPPSLVIDASLQTLQGMLDELQNASSDLKEAPVHEPLKVKKEPVDDDLDKAKEGVAGTGLHFDEDYVPWDGPEYVDEDLGKAKNVWLEMTCRWRSWLSWTAHRCQWDGHHV